MVVDGFSQRRWSGVKWRPRDACWASQAAKRVSTWVGEGGEFGVLVEGVADEGDEVGEDALTGTADFGLVERFVGAPEGLRGPGAGWGFEGVGEGADVFEAETFVVGAAVEDLEGGDLVAVGGDELLEGADEGLGAVGGFGGEGGFEDDVGADLVDRLLVALFGFEERGAEVGVGGEGVGGAFEQVFGGLGDLGGGGVGARWEGVGGAGGVEVGVGVEGGDDGGGDVAEGGPLAAAVRASRSGLSNWRSRRARRPAREERTSGSVLPKATAWSSLSKGTVWLAFQGRGVGLLGFADADAVDDDEVGLCLGVGGDGLEVGLVDDADAAALHLLEEVAALTARMKKTISSGLMSVPVAIMSR